MGRGAIIFFRIIICPLAIFPAAKITRYTATGTGRCVLSSERTCDFKLPQCLLHSKEQLCRHNEDFGVSAVRIVQVLCFLDSRTASYDSFALLSYRVDGLVFPLSGDTGITWLSYLFLYIKFLSRLH